MKTARNNQRLTSTRIQVDPSSPACCKCVFHCLLLAFCFFVMPVLTAAENIYSWEGADGRVYYGSKPPARSGAVKQLSPKSFSKYSSDKVLKGFGWNERMPEIKQSDIPLPETKDRQPLSLEHEEVQASYDEDNQITSCEVVIKNTSALPTQNIVVSFQLSDGTMVLADGPNSLAPDSGAIYRIPPEQLPLTPLYPASGKSNAGQRELPQVIIQAE